MHPYPKIENLVAHPRVEFVHFMYFTICIETDNEKKYTTILLLFLLSDPKLASLPRFEFELSRDDF